MTEQTKQARHVPEQDAEWITRLAQCIDGIGTDAFAQSLIAALKSLSDFDYSVVFAYYRSEKPVCAFHTFSPENRVVFVENYLKGPYLLDPFFKACGRKVEAGLYRLRDIAPDRFYQSEYYRSYYVQTGLSEEICYTLYLPDDIAIVVSLMRSGERSRFSAREFRLLKSVAPIVVSVAQRHWRDISQKFDVKTGDNDPHDDQSRVAGAVHDLFGQRITPRETQVIAQVLEGHSSDSIAKNLGIAVGTVRIHRRNVYAKLQISSQQELFSIFFKRITTAR